MAGKGLEEIFFVRVDAKLKRELQAEVARREKASPGLVFSQAGVIRLLLWEALKVAKEKSS